MTLTLQDDEAIRTIVKAETDPIATQVNEVYAAIGKLSANTAIVFKDLSDRLEAIEKRLNLQ